MITDLDKDLKMQEEDKEAPEVGEDAEKAPEEDAPLDEE